MSSLSIHPSSFIYTQCDHCGIHCVGPQMDEKMKKGGLENSCKKVLFSYNWQGYLSNKEGLIIAAPNEKIYEVLNADGSFKITFSESQDPKITSQMHECSTLSNNNNDIHTSFYRAPTPYDIMGYDLRRKTPPASGTNTGKASKTVPKMVATAEDVLAKKSLNPSDAKKSTALSQIKPPDFKKGPIYLGTCVHSELQNSFSYAENAADEISSNSTGAKFSTTTIMGLNKKIIIQINEKGIFINGVLREREMGTFKLEALPGHDKFRFTKT